MERLAAFFLYILGILWIVVGSLAIFSPDMVRNKILSKVKRASLKKFSVVGLIIGVLLMLSASYNRYSFLIIVLGLCAILKGIFAMFATQKLASFQKWWLQASPTFYRAWGAIMILIGSIVLTGI